MSSYIPPFTITNTILLLVAQISEEVGAISVHEGMHSNPVLRRQNRIKTIQASLAIENNTLSLEQVTAILAGKRILGNPREIHEVRNAYEAYEHMLELNPYDIHDLLHAHKMMMQDLIQEAGEFRSGDVGVFAEDEVIHIAPPASQVSPLIYQLFSWYQETDLHPLVKSCVFHYEFEFIHPFQDGNGRMGRMWHTLLLAQWKSIFAWLPIETMVKQRQSEYYGALRMSDQSGDSTPFIEFFLETILDTLHHYMQNDQENDQESDQVKALLQVMGEGAYSAKQLMDALGLSHRPTFRKNYLNPAIEQGIIEMTVPDAPTSKLQKYRKRVSE